MTDTPALKWPDDFDPVPGAADPVEPGLRRILAPNASPMTYRGTNTYLLGRTDLAVIDPGPGDESHLDAILGAVGPDQRISHIIVTHTHRDHSALARPLADRTGAPVLAFGGPADGRSAIMTGLAESGLGGGGEGLDLDFAPDIRIGDGDRVEGPGWALDVLHTPGHLGNHVSLGWGAACFTGDHIMGWASSVVSPPDGDIGDFMASCRRLQDTEWRVFYPGHGAPVRDPAGRLRWMIDHRLKREAAILAALALGPSTPQVLAARIYTETPRRFLAMATRNVFAHLIDLTRQKKVAPDGELGQAVVFRRL